MGSFGVPFKGSVGVPIRFEGSFKGSMGKLPGFKVRLRVLLGFP